MRFLFGFVLLLVGVAVFAVRLQHGGPYILPEGGNLLAGIGSLLVGAFFLGRGMGEGGLASLLGWGATLGAVAAIYFSAFAIMSEMEEVVSLNSTGASGQPVSLRLWIVDRDGAAWVTMRKEKADASGLTGGQAQLLRNGAWNCVSVSRHPDRENTNAVHHLRTEKYAVQRFAMRLGVFGEDAGTETIALRLSACDAD
jgi:hypothetical protein